MPKGMTASKLRNIAGWMDTLDLLLDRLDVPSDPTWREKLERARGDKPRNAIQSDLRRWADELEAKRG